MDAQRPPSRASKHWQSGLAHAQASRWPAAAQEFERATALSPLDAVYRLNLARALARLNRIDEAIESAQRSFELDPTSPLACRILAEYLTRQYRHAEAADCFARLSPEAPRDHDFHSAHGVALFSCGRLQEAIEVFFRSLALKIDAPLVHYRLGLTFKDLNMKEEASECFRTAVILDDGGVRAMALALLVHESAQACQWEHLAAETLALREAVGKVASTDGTLLSPFAFIAIECTPAEQRHVGMLRASALGRTLPRLPPLPKRRAPGRIRVGYLSSDFYNHATAVLMAELLEQRDTDTFEVVLYSHSRNDHSVMRQRVMAACDRFVDVNSLGNVALSERIRADGIDILVDLKGHTRDSRFEVLAARPAPVQVSYLGYPGTTGADYIDYVIGDAVVTPLSSEADFSEKIAQMPWSYQPNDRQRVRPPSPGRAACGLADDAVVLCCFNQAYKISPAVIDVWVRILHQAPLAVLWMLSWNDQAERNLLKELKLRGVDASRVVFAPKLSLTDHLARLQCADLLLDTWPCNAHTTASEALWMGVPVVTLPGATFASRVAASLARATRTDELVCSSEDDYVATTVALVHDLPRLRELQQQLADQRMELPLFDSPAYTRDLESLLRRMHERQLQGLPADHLPAAG
jgi:predicted O-linked N-acetylglucosamine transferase (SPINDLY family)